MITSHLRVYRKKAGLTQAELAEIVDARRETVLRLETGQYNASLELALRIAKVVQAPVDKIFVIDWEYAPESE